MFLAILADNVDGAPFEQLLITHAQGLFVCSI